jgi:hypothetical protein
MIFWRKLEETMCTALRRMAITATAVATIAGATLALPTTSDATWGGWHGGGWHGGGWRGGGWGWGVGPGFALGLGLGAAPYYAYGGPYYGSYAYGGDCVMRRRAVINRWEATRRVAVRATD